MRAKGKLLIIGGAEDKGEELMDMEIKNIRFKRYEILKTLLLTSKFKPIEIITTGSRVPKVVRRSYERVFDKIGYGKPGFMDIKSPGQANRKAFLDRIIKAGAVFFSGGDQYRLARILANTDLIQLIKYRYYSDKNFLLAGTSAGAMALSDIMIQEGRVVEAMIAHNLKMCPGLNIISNLIIDTHFIKRGRFGRLAQAIVQYPDHLGVGLGEDTALIIKNGVDTECRGSGMVVIIDGHHITTSNIKDVKKGEPISVQNLKVDLLVKGTRYNLKRRH